MVAIHYSKGGFFSESAIRFSDLQISKKIYSKKLSWAWNLNFPPITLYCLEIWKTNRTFWKKATFSWIKLREFEIEFIFYKYLIQVIEFVDLLWEKKGRDSV